MVSKTNEEALETLITNFLIKKQGYYEGLPVNFDKIYGTDSKYFWKFLKKTQIKELDKLKRFGNDWELKILERFDRLVKKHGILQLLKKGISVDDAHFYLMHPAPLISSSQTVKKNFEENIFSCTRQLTYSKNNPLEEIDVVLFINGIPFATLELKNVWTGQTARYHGCKQYREDRDNSQALFQFGRCLVHMAVDTDEVYMSTKIAGKSTVFLPFNKGFNGGDGNPPNATNHKTSYLWEDVFSRKSVANIIQHFMRFDGSSKERLEKRTLLFPRYHQLDVVRKLISHVNQNGVGQTYLIQHSACSGKSNSITWAAYQLIEAYPCNAKLPGAKGIEKPLFDSVIVVTDRRILDRQLRENIKEFSEMKQIIAPVYKSSELKNALEQGKKIIITTIQKFPFIIDGIEDLSDKRFAVIIDEAHSSQSGSAHDKMNRTIGKDSNSYSEKDKDIDVDIDDSQEKIIEAMRSRKMRGNASYFAFTATPKKITLEKFGTKNTDGSFQPFHLYTMKQAIKEGFILDVLSNYTTYKSYYEIKKSTEDNPLFNTRKAQKKLRVFVERNPGTINVKAEIMLDHFIEKIVNTKKLKGKAKGIIITQNIESTIRYFKAIRKLLEQRGNPFKAIIAFSGVKKIDGIEYTEENLNGFSDSKTKDFFDGYDENLNPIIHNGKSIENTYRLLIVANKYLTGFDQPKLTSMYIDKKLQDVMCVQALSRLNRSAPKLGKKKEDLFVLDFFNSVEDIKRAFDVFYSSTSLSEATDVNVLHELKELLQDVGVYKWNEIEKFISLYFDDAEAQKLSPIIDVSAHRFNEELELQEDEKADFKIKAKQFVKVYGQMASIIPFEVIDWEKLFWFLKFLIPKLIVKDPEAKKIDELLDAVDLSSYGLERVKLSHSIGLDDSETILEPQSSNPRGSYGDDEGKDTLDEIITNFNERWFQGWTATPEEQRIKFINLANSIRSHPDFEKKYKNNLDKQNRELAFEKIFEEVILNNRRNELELYKLLANDPDFKAAMQENLRKLTAN